VLWDIRNQTLLPFEVIVSLSETSLEAGEALEDQLKRDIFSGT
jgi:hypothetical protein